jgi:HNH endonuclease
MSNYRPTRQADAEPMFVDFDFLLLLHAHMLESLADINFTHRTTEKLRSRVRRERGIGIVHRPQKIGVAHYFASAAIDNYFEYLSDYQYSETKGFYDVFQLLGILRSAWFTSSWRSRKVKAFTSEISKLKEQSKALDGEDWCDLAIDQGAPLVERLAVACRSSRDYVYLRRVYSIAIADRLIHDRHICAHLAGLLNNLAPKGGKGAFVKRVKWPSHALRTVIARDRGKCSYCHVDIAMELLARPHIDHIVPISRGGCNDIVNLQLCCEACNLEKANGAMDIEPSVPRYLDSRYVVFIDM